MKSKVVKRILAAGMVAAMLLAMLAGCGDKGASKDAGDKGAAQKPSRTSSPARARILAGGLSRLTITGNITRRTSKVRSCSTSTGSTGIPRMVASARRRREDS